MSEGTGYEEADYLVSAQVGTRYRVKWADCCARGSFEATLTTKNYADIDGYPPYVNSLTFDNGVTISGMKVEIEAAQSAPEPS
jgi:hypothetical protein